MSTGSGIYDNSVIQSGGLQGKVVNLFWFCFLERQCYASRHVVERQGFVIVKLSVAVKQA